MKRTQFSGLPSASVSYLVICSALVLAFLAVAVYPSLRTKDSQDKEIDQIKAQIEDQKVLQPIYTMLLEKLRQEDAANLQTVPKTVLSFDQIDQIASLLGEIVKKHGLRLITATPDVKTMAKDAKSIALDVVMKGDFQSFRKVLLELIALPYVEHAEKLQIQEIADGKEFRLKLWLATDGAKGDVKT